MPDPVISDLPDPPSRSENPSVFAAKSDALLGGLPGFVTQMNSAISWISDKISSIVGDADAAAASANAAAASANAAAASSDVYAHVPNAAYTAGESMVFSPSTFQTYRAKTAHSGISTDPASDTTNWQPVTIDPDDVAATYLPFAGGIVTGPLKAYEYQEAKSELTGTTPTLNCELGNVFTLTTSGNTTLAISNPPAAGTAYSCTLILTMGGAHALTWPGAVKWPNAEIPALPDASAIAIYVLTTYDGGATWFAMQSGSAFA